MKKSSFALVLLSSPAFAQTPNLAPAPPIDRVGNPVLCLPIGKTSKGDLVYSLDCRNRYRAAPRTRRPNGAGSSTHSASIQNNYRAGPRSQLRRPKSRNCGCSAVQQLRAQSPAAGNGIFGCRDRAPKIIAKKRERLQRPKSGK
jgi:hypothetical protein